ncbi:MAG: endoribonuclease MazF [Vicinamibacterales bacterium]
MRSWVPDAGDFIWLTFDPQAGREQQGRRPALVLSPKPYNAKAGLALACPITGKVKGYPFESVIPEGSVVSGAVLCDHVKSLDWAERRAELAGRAPESLVHEVRERLRPLLGL